MSRSTYNNRHTIVFTLFLLVMLLYVVRIFHLQIIESQFGEQAINNATYKQTIYPARGLIYDRNGNLVVYNQPSFDVLIVVQEISKKFDTLAFCNLLNISKIEFKNKISEIKRDGKKNKYIPQILLSYLTDREVSPLREELYKFPCVSINKRTLRSYNYPYAAHVLGTIGEVAQKDLEADEYYALGDYIGTDGIEKSYEKRLRGRKGVEVYARDVKGKYRGSFEDGRLDRNAVSGEDLTLTLDIELQALAERLLSNKVGSVIAIEPASGEVLALASSPTWQPENLVGKKRSQEYKQLHSNPNKPLFNRATQAQYSPGSTFKTIQALICLQENVITKNTAYSCAGPSSVPIKCTHYHGSPVRLLNAIEQSCNPFFWQAYRDLLQKRDPQKKYDIHNNFNLWRDYVLRFGLGNSFGESDILDQSKGSVPRSEDYDRIYGKTGWRAMTVRSLSIGQGELLITPLQLANQACIIANRGFYITPHLLKDTTHWQQHLTGIDTAHFDVVKEGMLRVMQYGTGRWYAINGCEVCGKTGTVENSHGKDHAVFLGFAPRENPQIAVAVVVENAGFGATWACPIATLLMEQYIKGEIERTYLAERIENTSLLN